MKKKTKKPTLKQLIAAARRIGATVTFSLEDNRMPRRVPGDHPHVTALLDESERTSALGTKWSLAQTPNPVAAEQAFRMGWAHALSAAWLRCYLKGELEIKPEGQK